MKRLPALSILCLCLGLSAAAQRHPAERELRALQDSVWHWRASHPGDPLSDNIRASGQTENAVEVHLMRADSAVRSDFRRRLHDSPLIRLCGFDPDTTPYPAAPEGEVPPAGTASMQAEYAFYAPGTEQVALTIRNAGDRELLFGEEYTLCRFQNDRWEILPAGGIWHSLLHGLRPGGEYRFPARLEPRIYPAVYARYRICKRAYAENPRRDWLLTAEFTLTPFVPFTRFNE